MVGLVGGVEWGEGWKCGHGSVDPDSTRGQVDARKHRGAFLLPKCALFSKL